MPEMSGAEIVKGGAINLTELAADAYLLKPTASQTGTLASGLAQTWTTNGTTEIVHMKNNAGVAEFGLYGQVFDYTTLHTPATNALMQFNGTKWVSGPAASSLAWSTITAPTAAAGFTDGGFATTITESGTTYTGWTFKSATLTSGILAAFTSTSTALAAGNALVSINSSGANGTAAITATGLSVSVTNTNATSGTNVGISITSSGATTANYGILDAGSRWKSTGWLDTDDVANNDSVYVGRYAGSVNTAASVMVGYQAGYSNTTGSSVMVGYQAGHVQHDRQLGDGGLPGGVFQHDRCSR